MDLQDIKDKISPILKKYGVKRAEVFGSVARGEATAGSDIDLMISLGQPLGLLAYVSLIREVEAELERKVDLVTDQSVNKFIKPYIVKELTTIYEG